MKRTKTRAAPANVGAGARVAVVRARWNEAVPLALERGAIDRATASGAALDLFEVAGSFELPAAVAMLADTGRYAAIVPIGCLIRGETAHFDVLAHAVTRGLMDLAISYPIAITFAVLTVESVEQAMARAGGSVGNVGAEAMDAALELVALRQALAGEAKKPRARSRAAKRSAR